MFPNQRKILYLLAGALLLSACSAPPLPTGTATPLPARQGVLTPFVTQSATVTPAPENFSTPAPLPSPTSTPRTHVVKKGEDMGGIAYRYHVTTQELLAANPTVNPNMMSVGTILTVPESKTPQPSQAPKASSEPPTPTPVPLELGRINCAEAREGGVWCFLPVKNPQDFAVEGVSVVIRAGDKNAQVIVPLAAFPPLDLLPAGVVLPVSAYFPPEMLKGMDEPYQFSGELLSALPNQDDGRYLPVEVSGQKVLVSQDGFSAEIQMDVRLSQPDQAAQRIWVAAVAYDSAGKVIGMRRWENPAGETMQSGKPYPVSMRVYSVAGVIDHVEMIAEARP